MSTTFGFEAVPDFVKYKQGDIYVRAGRTIVAIQDGQPRYRVFANAPDAVAFLEGISRGELIEDGFVLGKRGVQ